MRQHRSLAGRMRLAAMLLGILACATRPQPAPIEREPTPTGPTIRVFEPTWSPDESTDFRPPVVPPRADARFECVGNEDCVVLEVGCCNHCNGGSLVAVNLASTATASSTFHERGCAETTCTERNCDWDYQAVCDAGTCARLERRELNGVATEVTLVHNAVASRVPGGPPSN